MMSRFQGRRTSFLIITSSFLFSGCHSTGTAILSASRTLQPRATAGPGHLSGAPCMSSKVQNGQFKITLSQGMHLFKYPSCPSSSTEWLIHQAIKTSILSSFSIKLIWKRISLQFIQISDPLKGIANSWSEEASSTQFYAVISFCIRKVFPDMRPFKFTGSPIILLLTNGGDTHAWFIFPVLSLIHDVKMNVFLPLSPLSISKDWEILFFLHCTSLDYH